jgi:hypothetical protein
MRLSAWLVDLRCVAEPRLGFVGALFPLCGHLNEIPFFRPVCFDGQLSASSCVPSIF